MVASNMYVAKTSSIWKKKICWNHYALWCFPRNFGDAMLQRLRWSWANLHWWSTSTVLRVYEPVALAFKAFEKKHVLAWNAKERPIFLGNEKPLKPATIKP